MKKFLSVLALALVASCALIGPADSVTSAGLMNDVLGRHTAYVAATQDPQAESQPAVGALAVSVGGVVTDAKNPDGSKVRWAPKPALGSEDLAKAQSDAAAIFVFLSGENTGTVVTDEDLKATAARVCSRHDTWVTNDPTLTPLQKRTYLRSSALLMQMR